MKEIKWAMIGCGDVTEKKTGPALYSAQGSRLVGVYSRTKERAEDWVRRHQHGIVYDTIEQLLDDSSVQAVYIATPPDSHFDYAMKILEAGKIPLIEKPMASDFVACQKIIKKAKQVELPLYVNFYRRGLEKFQTIKQLLEDGAIGEVLTVTIRHYSPLDPELKTANDLPWRYKKEAGGGKALDSQIHVIDYLMWLFGDIEAVNGFAANRAGAYEVEDTIVASFKFKSRVFGTATWSYTASEYVDQVDIQGTKGTMSFSGTGVTDLRVNDENYQFEAPDHVGLPYIQMIVDHLLSGGDCPADTHQAAQTVYFFDQLLADYRRGIS